MRLDRPIESGFATTSTIASGIATAQAFKRSPTAYDIDQMRARAHSRTARLQELRELAFAAAHDVAPACNALSEELQPYFQVSAGSSSHTLLAEVLLLLREAGWSPEVVPAHVDPLAADNGCVVEVSINAFAGIDAPNVHMQGYLLLVRDDVWTLKLPVILEPDGSVGVLPDMANRFARLDGPFRFGLTTTEEAPRRLGDEVCRSGSELAVEYVSHVNAGRNVNDGMTWRASA